jgi:hypothetical protein
MRPTFDDALHLYTLHGSPVPSVTELIDQAGLKRGDWYTEESRDRGKAIHRIGKSLLLAEDVGESDTAFVMDKGYEGYVTALQRFIADKRLTPVFVEVPLADPSAWFAGTADFIGGISDAPYAVVDFKTGPPMPWHSVQTEAYSRLAYLETGVPYYKRFGLYLREDGEYRLVPHLDILGDAKAFDAALTIYHFLADHPVK